MKRLRSVSRRCLYAALACLCASCASSVPQPSGPRADPVAAQASSAARLAYEQGDFAQARAQYRRALTRARAINDAALGADAAYNLAMSEIGLGNYAAADRLLGEAFYDAGRASSGTADIVLLRAKVAYLDARLPDALTLIGEVTRATAAPSLQLQAMLLRGQILADTADAAGAKSELQAVERRAGSRAALTPAIGADLAKLEGTIARLEGRMDAAAQAFDAEAELLRTAHRYRDMGYALARVAEAYLAAGRYALAADRFFLAARSFEARGDAGGARTLAASSIAAADKAKDASARARAQALIEDLTRRAAP